MSPCLSLSNYALIIATTYHHPAPTLSQFVASSIIAIVLASIEWCPCCCKSCKPVTWTLKSCGSCLRTVDTCVDVVVETKHCQPCLPGPVDTALQSCFCDNRHELNHNLPKSDENPNGLEEGKEGLKKDQEGCAPKIWDWLKHAACIEHVWAFLTSGGVALFFFVYAIYVFNVAYRGFGDNLHFREGVNTMKTLSHMDWDPYGQVSFNQRGTKTVSYPGNPLEIQPFFDEFDPQKVPDDGVVPAGNWNRGPITGFALANLQLTGNETVLLYGKLPDAACQHLEGGGWERLQFERKARFKVDAPSSLQTFGLYKRKLRTTTVTKWRNEGFCVQRAPSNYSAMNREAWLKENKDKTIFDFYGDIDPLVEISADINETETPAHQEECPQPRVAYPDVLSVLPAVAANAKACSYCPNSTESGTVNTSGLTYLYFCNMVSKDFFTINATFCFSELVRPIFAFSFSLPPPRPPQHALP